VEIAATPGAARPVRPPRPHTASPEELERHGAFVAGLENAIWTSGAPA
jgi:DNA polymerase-3 subunit epsilon